MRLCSPETDDGADSRHENGEENTDDDDDRVERDDLAVAGEHRPIDRVENGNPANITTTFKSSL